MYVEDVGIFDDGGGGVKVQIKVEKANSKATNRL